MNRSSQKNDSSEEWISAGNVNIHVRSFVWFLERVFFSSVTLVDGFMNVYRVESVLIIISQTLNCNLFRREMVIPVRLISWLAAPSAAFVYTNNNPENEEF